MRHANYILSAITALKVIVFAGITGNLLSGCAKTDTGSMLPVASSEPIEFGVSTPQTKGMPELYTLERLAAQDFSVSAWYTPDGETFGTGSTHYLHNHRFGTLETEVLPPELPDYEHALWQGITRTGDKAADPAYFPLDGTLTFFCYAPYRENMTDESDVYVIPNPDPAITTRLANYLPGSPLIRFQPMPSTVNQIDLIASTPLLDVDRSHGTIPLDFTKHLTTQVRFYVNYAGSMDPAEGVKVTQILIQDVISSEYLYFTETPGTLGMEWNSTISPADGTSDMPKASYTLALANSALQNAFLEQIDDSTPEALEASYTFVNQTTNGITYLLPQAIPAGAKIEMTYVIQKRSNGDNLDENVIICDIPATPWPQGKIVRYNITIGVPARQIVHITTSIEPWVDAGNNHDPEELMY